LETGAARVLRGGSWGSEARHCRGACRRGSPPDDRYDYPRDHRGIAHHLRYQTDDPYLQQVQNGWNDGLCRAFNQLPRLPWEETASG